MTSRIPHLDLGRRRIGSYDGFVSHREHRGRREAYTRYSHSGSMVSLGSFEHANRVSIISMGRKAQQRYGRTTHPWWAARLNRMRAVQKNSAVDRAPNRREVFVAVAAHSPRI
jgi:hypothetical protein